MKEFETLLIWMGFDGYMESNHGRTLVYIKEGLRGKHYYVALTSVGDVFVAYGTSFMNSDLLFGEYYGEPSAGDVYKVYMFLNKLGIKRFSYV